MMLSNHLILCHPLLLPSIFPSIKVFSSESALRIRWPKYYFIFPAQVFPFPGLLIVLFVYLVFEAGEGNGTPLQYSCLENPMDGGAW